jgi:hypothetical protein
MNCAMISTKTLIDDKNNRRSITGYLILLHDVPISWKSKQQGGVTLSSSEAEYYAISEVAMELKFLKMILNLLEIDSGGSMRVFNHNHRFHRRLKCVD